MAEPKTIRKLPEGDVAGHFAELRRRGLDMLAEMTGGEWTNFNEGDPGVTLLEALCFALTDLAYRTSRPPADLLADRDGRVDLDKLLLYPPSQILTSNPIIEDDYRRLLLDRFPEILDARLRPAQGPPAGRYRVEIATAPGLDLEAQTRLRAAVAEELNAYRNLCEVFSSVEITQPRRLSFYVEIELRDDYNPEETGYAVLRRVYEHLSPPVVFRSLAELQEAGVSVDDAYSGPLLENGFLLDEDLPRPIPSSDLSARIAATILETPGVLGIRSGPALSLDSRPLSSSSRLDIGPIRLDLAENLPTIHFIQGSSTTPFVSSATVIRHLQDAAPTRRYPVSPRGSEDLRGRPPFDAETYYSIQNGLPRIYRLHANAFDPSAPAARQAQARQLKGYLLTFEQLLANYLAQLAHLGDLFSATPQEQTYFVQPLYSVPDVGPLLEGFPIEAVVKEPGRFPELWRELVHNRANPYVRGLARETEDRRRFLERRTRFLDHLLARFGEAFPNDSRLTYETIANKEQYLTAYRELGRARANAFDYAVPSGAPARRDQATLVRKLDVLLRKGAEGPPPLASLFVSPGTDPARFEKAVRALEDQPRLATEIVEPTPEGFQVVVTVPLEDGPIRLEVRGLFSTLAEARGLIDDLEANLAAYRSRVAADIYLVETILLAPTITGGPIATPQTAAPATGEPPPDGFYEFQAVWVMTNWTAAKPTLDFKTYVQRMIDHGSPAHIRNIAVWLEPREMLRFRAVYHAWEEQLAGQPVPSAEPPNEPPDEPPYGDRPASPAQRLLAWLREHWPEPGDPCGP